MIIRFPKWTVIQCIFLIVLIYGNVFSQSGKVIELRSTDELSVRSVGEEEVREFKGNVHFVQPSQSGGMVMVWCDQAIQYLRQNKIDLFGNVKVVRDSVTMTSQRGTYFGDDRRAKMISQVQLRRGSMQLDAMSGEYFGDKKKAFFSGNVVVVDSVSSTTSDFLTYFEEEDKSIAVGNVKAVNHQTNTTVYGDTLFHFGPQKYSRIPASPRLVKIDSSSSGSVDTLVVIGKQMEAYTDTMSTYYVHKEVSLVRSDISAQCGELLYDRSKETITLHESPIIWYGENQITGDTVVVHLKENVLSWINVSGRSMVISKADLNNPRRFDQITGKNVQLFFDENTLHRIAVERNATSLYYLFDENEPNGVNRSTGDRITIEFEDGKVQNISVVGGVEGKYFPEQMIYRREEINNLDGFKWITEKPIRQLDSIILPSSK